MIIILQEVQQEINKMIEEAPTSESDDDDDDLSDDTVEGRIQCSCDMLILCGECVQ